MSFSNASRIRSTDRRNARRRLARAVDFAVERLEQRQLLSAATVTVNNGVSPFTIKFNIDSTLASVQGTPALNALKMAALAWESRLTNNITVTIDASIGSINGSLDAVADAQPTDVHELYSSVRSQLIATAGPATTAVENALPTETQFRAEADIVAGDTLDTGLNVPTAELRALGFTGLPTTSDGAIAFSSQIYNNGIMGLPGNTFYFDDGANGGIQPGQFDFESAAMHEIGHVLGFQSSVDVFDSTFPNPSHAVATPLDLFRLPAFDDHLGISQFDVHNVPVQFANFTNATRELAYDEGAEVGDYTSPANPQFYLTGEGSKSSISGTDKEAADWIASTAQSSAQVTGTMDADLPTGTIQLASSADFNALNEIGYSVKQEPNIKVTDARLNPAIAGTNVTYTISITNTDGHASAHNVLIVDDLPGNVSFVSAAQLYITPHDAPLTINTAGGNVTGAAALLTPNQGSTLEIVYHVNANAAGNFIDTTVTGSTTDTESDSFSEHDDIATTDDFISNGFSDLLATDTASPTSIAQNGTVTYTVSVENFGPLDAPNTTLHDSLPANGTNVSILSSAGFTTTNVTGNTLSGTITSLPVGQTATIVYTEQANDPYNLHNSVSVSSDNSDPSPDVHPDSASATVSVTPAPVAGVTTFPFTVEEGAIFNGKVGSFTDPVGASPSATIDWGDGTTTAGVVTANATPGVYDVSGSHFYGDAFNDLLGGVPYFDAVVTFTDTPFTATGPFTATVTDAPLVAGPTAPVMFLNEGSFNSVTVGSFVDQYPQDSSTGGIVSNPFGTDDFIATITWGDGNVSDGSVSQDANNPNLYTVSGSNAYQQPGLYSVSVFVTDDGATVSLSQQVLVVKSPLTPIPQTLSAVEGANLTNVVIASFTDANTTATPGDYIANIDWGDGTAGSVGKVQIVPTFDQFGDFLGNQENVVASHTYADDGVYSPIVTVKDGTSSTFITSSVIVSDPAVVGVGAPTQLTGVEGASTGTVVLATFTDPGGAEPNASDSDPTLLDHYQPAIDWGDGTPSDTTSVGVTYNASTGVFTVTGSHTYAEESSIQTIGSNSYIVKVTLNHEDAPPATVFDSVAVSDPSVAALGGVSLTAIEGGSTGVQKLATFTDPGGAEALSDYTALINWGDGTAVTTGTLTFSAGVFTVSGNHTYAEESNPGTPFSVVVDVKHDVAPDALATDTATVSDPAVIGTPVAPIVGIEGTATGSIVLATFVDPAGAEVTGDYSATINWGDGSAASIGTIAVNTGVFTVSGNHTYAEESGPDVPNSTPYKIVVTINHEAAPTTLVTDTATISDPAVIGAAVAPISAVEGLATGPITVATFSDPGGAETTADYSATINWGDGGATSAGTITVAGGTFTVTGNHTYAEESAANHPNSTPYQISVTLNHEAATATVVSDTATVSDPSVIGASVAPITGVEGTDTGVITLATFSDPGGAEAASDYSATINWGDGGPTSVGTITANGGTFTVSGNHTYAEESGPEHAGSQPYQVTVTLNHEAAPATVVTDTATITDPAVIPTAGDPVSSVETFSTGPVVVATFTDPGGNTEDPADYSATIDWGDGTTPDAAVISYDAVNQVFDVTGVHTYDEESGPDHPNSQPYQIGVTISHENAPDAFVNNTATIDDPAVIATGVNPINAKKGVSTGSITLANFTDPADADPTGAYSATIDWGDGSATSNGSISFSGGVFTVKGTHTYNSVGQFFPTIVVHHEQADDSNIVTDTVNVTAPASPLTSTGTTNSGIEGRSSTVKVASFVTTNNSAVIGNFTASINWGDGKVTTGTIVKDSNGHFHVNGSHAYAEEAAAMGFANGFPVTVTIKDNASHTTVANSTYKIADAPLDSGAGVSLSKTHNVAFASTTTLGTFRDQDALNKTPSDFTGTINWGDGTTSTATFVYTGATANVGSFWKITGGHTYKTAKTYTVKITVTDKGGASPITITTTIKVV